MRFLEILDHFDIFGGQISSRIAIFDLQSPRQSEIWVPENQRTPEQQSGKVPIRKGPENNNFGVHGREETTEAGENWMSVLGQTGFALLNSYANIEKANRHTFVSSGQNWKKSEIDHLLARKDQKHRFGEFYLGELGLKKRNRNGELIDALDHKFAAIEIDVYSFGSFVSKFKERTTTKKILDPKPDPAKKAAFNEKLRQLNPSSLEMIIDFCVQEIEELKIVPPATDPQELVDNLDDFSRNNIQKVWDELKTRGKQKIAPEARISDEQGAEQYRKNASPMTNFSATEEFFNCVEKLNKEIIENLNAPLTLGEFKKAKTQIHVGKAKDPHGLPTKILNYFDNSSLETVKEFCNAVFMEESIDSLGEAMHGCRVTKLYKKGDPEDPVNYRYIVVCSALMKLLGKVLGNRLEIAAEKGDLFWPTNFGFRKGFGCADSLIVFSRLAEDLSKYRDSDLFMKVASVFVDLRKAFPSMCWNTVELVFKKLGLIEVDGGNRFWKGFQALHRSARYKFGKVDTFTVPNGFKEGDVTSAIGFIVVYSAVMKCFLQQLKNSATEIKGVKLASLPNEMVFDRVEGIKKLIFPDAATETEIIYKEILDLIFADDTTLFQEVEKLLDALDLGSSALGVYLKTINACGMQENESKREADLVTDIKIRNMGSYNTLPP